MEKYLASKLSGSAVKVLLSLVLTRHLEVEWSIAEFAIRTGLHTDMLRVALVGLSTLNLIASVTQSNHKSLVNVQGVGINVEENMEKSPTVSDGLVLDSKVGRGSDGVAALLRSHTLEVSDGADPVEPLRESARADIRGNMRVQLRVIQAAWESNFPEKRLVEGVVRKWLDQYKSAEFVVEVIEKVGQYNADHPVNSPYTYVEGALKREFEKKEQPKPDNGVEITPELWNLVKIGRKQRGYDKS